MKNSTILILKGIMFYGTFISILLFIGGIDSIWDMGLKHLFLCILQIAINVFLCVWVISKDDLKKITFYDKINRMIEED